MYCVQLNIVDFHGYMYVNKQVFYILWYLTLQQIAYLKDLKSVLQSIAALCFQHITELLPQLTVHTEYYWLPIFGTKSV